MGNATEADFEAEFGGKWAFSVGDQEYTRSFGIQPWDTVVLIEGGAGTPTTYKTTLISGDKVEASSLKTLATLIRDSLEQELQRVTPIPTLAKVVEASTEREVVQEAARERSRKLAKQSVSETQKFLALNS